MKLQKIKDLMEVYSNAYYNGNPLISNEEYDALERIHGQIISGVGEIPHAYRMYSLKKHYDRDGALPVGDYVKSEKLDGAAADLTYVNGALTIALTRGDGIKGRDITDKVRTLDIPSTIPKQGIVQVTGEIVAHKDMDNSRNYASGALNQKDMNVWNQKRIEGSIEFIAYNVQVAQNLWGLELTYEDDLVRIGNWGFNVIGEENPMIWSDMYPTDGIVYRLNSNVEFNRRGFTDKFPRGAFAYKEEAEAVSTKLMEVIWQTGKSGKVTPVGILEPIVIGEATISRATLNNIAYIEALDLEIGCTVQVIRSGEIIPKIIGRIYD